MQWYYANNGQRQGPVGDDEFQRLVGIAGIRDDTLVWREGMPDWIPYAQLRGTPFAVPVAGSGTGTEAVPDDTEVCAVSGKRFPRREMIQYEGRWVSAQHRDEFFQRIREGVLLPAAGAVPGPFGYGGFWLRVVARIIDGIATGVVGAFVGGFIGLFFGLSGALNDNVGAMIAFQGAVQGIGIAIALSYDIFFIRKFDATPGKMALGLKILRPDGGKLSVGRIVGRYFAHILNVFTFLIGYIIVAFDDQKRALHDHVCDTRVVKTR